MNDGERIKFRLWVFVERLHLPNLLEPESDAPYGGLSERPGGGANPLDVLVSVGKDGKLMFVPDLMSAGFNERGDDVIERGSHIVYDVTDDDAEAKFLEICGLVGDAIPRAVWLDLVHPQAVRLSLIKSDLALSLEGFEVYCRPCDFCLAGSEIET